MSKVVVIGAGKTGRGFLARLLREEREEIIFIDKNEALVDRLNAEGTFRVRFFGDVRKPYEINHFRAYTWNNASLDDASLILVSVGGQNLNDVGARLAPLLEDGRQYYIITGENASKPAETLRNAIGKEHVFVSEATVFCTTIEAGELDILSENYPCLQCDADLLGEYMPEAKTIQPIANFSNFLTRKLFTYNAASCVIAYLGWQKGYTIYADAANDEEILKLLDSNYAVTNRVLCEEFGYEAADQEAFAALSKAKFCDRAIVDTIVRNARDPLRKLGANERIIGPVRLLHKYGQDASVLERTAAAAILYAIKDEEATDTKETEKRAEQILTDVCGLDAESTIFKNIMFWFTGLAPRRTATVQ